MLAGISGAGVTQIAAGCEVPWQEPHELKFNQGSVSGSGESPHLPGGGQRCSRLQPPEAVESAFELAVQENSKLDIIELSALSMMEVAMIDLREVRSVTEFQRNIKDYVGRLKENKKAMVLTVNGRAELVVQDAESYQLILERLERAETLASIRRGIEQIDRGEGIAVGEAEAKLRKKHGFSR